MLYAKKAREQMGKKQQQTLDLTKLNLSSSGRKLLL